MDGKQVVEVNNRRWLTSGLYPECNRCHQLCKHGFYSKAMGVEHKYFRQGEELICGDCMWKDPDFIRDNNLFGHK